MNSEIKIGAKVTFSIGDDTYSGIVINKSYNSALRVKSGDSYFIVDSSELEVDGEADDPSKKKRGKRKAE